MPTTKADMRDKVLRHLTVLAAGEAATAEDAIEAEAAVDSVYDHLIVENLVYWDIEDFPLEIQIPFRNAAAATLVDTFEIPEPRATRLEVLGQRGLATIRSLAASRPDSDPIKAEYF